MKRMPLDVKIRKILIEEGMESFVSLAPFLARELKPKLEADETRSLQLLLSSQKMKTATALLLSLDNKEPVKSATSTK